MRCPKCSKIDLKHESVGGTGRDAIAIDRCPSCGGMWFDMLELDNVLKLKPAELLRADVNAAYARRAAGDEAEKRLNCPRCEGTVYLIKMKNRTGRGAMVDSCKVCFGAWLDAGELARLAAPRGLFGWIASLVKRK